MDEKKLKKILEEKLKGLSEEDIEKLEQYLAEEKELRREKIRQLKELIEKGEYEIPPEKVAEKILEFIKKNR
ncbi:anti-sigma-28 factor, FlgM family [Persephonella hydrogeniphila]|uniref:Negative regulator of flagellin synthesis n=1 Tax=Persephonella hydrogeniphila TaxID=198703 RepID=A0A285NKH1_9AQUI|nr:flagellar biosynthesis anti-sigma factor FlgM [Persephonella hydrogeniphila]SNZ09457.1 anti-sigma-28 factor, FlgM family [Persephonella hydrogeniphila]